MNVLGKIFPAMPWSINIWTSCWIVTSVLSLAVWFTCFLFEKDTALQQWHYPIRRLLAIRQLYATTPSPLPSAVNGVASKLACEPNALQVRSVLQNSVKHEANVLTTVTAINLIRWFHLTSKMKTRTFAFWICFSILIYMFEK